MGRRTTTWSPGLAYWKVICWRSRMLAVMRSRSKWWTTGREKERRKESGTGRGTGVEVGIGETGEEAIVRRGGVIEGGIGTGIEMEEIGKETEETTIEIDDMMIEKGEKRGEEVVVVEKDDLSVEETNKLRAELGLPPLK